MERLQQKLLRHKGLVSISFILLAALCLALSRGVKVNYNMVDYLPPTADSTLALEEMDAAYTKSVPNLRVMMRNVSVPQALAIKEALLAVPGVEDINWLDDMADIYTPLEMLDEKTLADWYVDGDALYSLVISDDGQKETLAGIRAIIGENGAISGNPVDTVEAQMSTGAEISRIMLIVIPAALGILLLTTTSWLEPFLLLFNLGIAIALNMGTNIFLGEISFVTNTTAIVLQLACSIDYSIFLLDRFGELRQEMDNPADAMARAVAQSASSIASSGLTTVVGFLALLGMQFGIGADMGIVLAKGIAFSLLATLFCMPCLAMFCYKLIDKTTHRSFLPSFARFGKWADRAKGIVTALVVLLLVPCFLAGRNIDFSYGMSRMAAPNSQVAQDKQAITGQFGESQSFALLVPNAGAGGSLATEENLVADVKAMPEVSSVLSYTETVGATIPSEYVPESALEMLYSGGFSRIVITARITPESAESFAFVEALRQTAENYYPGSYHLAGEVANVLDMRDTITADSLLVNLLSIGGIAVILLFTFKSVSLPFILLLTIESSIFINMAVPYFTGQNLNYIGYLVISSVQLGATVDYAILFANRYIVVRGRMPRKQAARRTITDTAGSIFTSGIILTMAGLVLGLVSTNTLISQLGMLLARGAALSTILVLVFLPALLALLDPVIQKTTWHCNFYTPPKGERSKPDKTKKQRPQSAKGV